MSEVILLESPIEGGESDAQGVDHLPWYLTKRRIRIASTTMLVIVSISAGLWFVTQPPTVAYVTVSANVSYGTLTVNNSAQLWLNHQLVPLHAGRNILVLDAPPFATACTLS